MTDITIVEFKDDVANCMSDPNKIRFRQETHDSLEKIRLKKGMENLKAIKERKKELQAIGKEVMDGTIEPDEKTIQKITRLELEIEFLTLGVKPSDESIDAHLEETEKHALLFKNRPIKLNDKMFSEIRDTGTAVRLRRSELATVDNNEKEIIENLIDEQANANEEEKTDDQIEEVFDDTGDNLEAATEEEALRIPFDVYQAEEKIEEKIEPEYAEVDASEEVNPTNGITQEEIKKAFDEVEVNHEEEKQEEPQPEEEKQSPEEIEILEEVETLFKEAQEIKSHGEDLKNARKKAEKEEKEKEERKREAEKAAAIKKAALKEALDRFKANMEKNKKENEAEEAARKEAEKRAKAISEETRKIEESTNATNKALEKILAMMGETETVAEPEEKKAHKRK